MKQKMLILLNIVSLIGIVMFFGGCFDDCDNVKNKNIILLVDISDNQLLNAIKSDLEKNSSNLFAVTGVNSLNACEEYSLSIAKICSDDALDIKKETIRIEKKYQSRRMEREQSNLAPIISLIKGNVLSYTSLSNSPEVTSKSYIANVLAKAINTCDKNNINTIFLFSDLIENDQYISFYRQIPSTKVDIKNSITRLIDPDIYCILKTKINGGLNPEIVLVMKSNSNNIDRVKLKTYWQEFFGELQLKNVKIVDNLSYINASTRIDSAIK